MALPVEEFFSLRHEEILTFRPVRMEGKGGSWDALLDKADRKCGTFLVIREKVDAGPERLFPGEPVVLDWRWGTGRQGLRLSAIIRWAEWDEEGVLGQVALSFLPPDGVEEGRLRKWLASLW